MSELDLLSSHCFTGGLWPLFHRFKHSSRGDDLGTAGKLDPFQGGRKAAGFASTEPTWLLFFPADSPAVAEAAPSPSYVLAPLGYRVFLKFFLPALHAIKLNLFADLKFLLKD